MAPYQPKGHDAWREDLVNERKDARALPMKFGKKGRKSGVFVDFSIKLERRSLPPLTLLEGREHRRGDPLPDSLGSWMSVEYWIH